jgi:hypothetical protein
MASGSLIMKLLILILGLTAAAAAQQLPEPPKSWPVVAGPSNVTVKGHHMGETFADWLRIQDIDLDGFCAKKGRWHERRLTGEDKKPICGQLARIRDTGTGFTGTGTIESYGIGLQRGIWEFRNGALGKVEFQHYLGYSRTVEGELELLKQAYGPPASLDGVPYQNGFGARFEEYSAMWTFPDGTYIIAVEGGKFSEYHMLRVVFTTAAYRKAEQESQRPAPNPYK